MTDSRGRRQGDTVGAATRAAFHALPTVGQKTAKQWWDLGCRWVVCSTEWGALLQASLQIESWVVGMCSAVLQAGSMAAPVASPTSFPNARFRQLMQEPGAR